MKTAFKLMIPFFFILLVGGSNQIQSTEIEINSNEWNSFFFTDCSYSREKVFDIGGTFNRSVKPINVFIDLNISTITGGSLIISYVYGYYDEQSNRDLWNSTHIEQNLTGDFKYQGLTKEIELKIQIERGVLTQELINETIKGFYRIHIEEYNKIATWNNFSFNARGPCYANIYNNRTDINNLSVLIEISKIDGELSLDVMHNHLFSEYVITEEGLFNISNIIADSLHFNYYGGSFSNGLDHDYFYVEGKFKLFDLGFVEKKVSWNILTFPILAIMVTYISKRRRNK